jgi:hypothetical protein
VINNGVDHVDDAKPDLSPLLQGASLGDAQGDAQGDARGWPRLFGLTPDDKARVAEGVKMLAEKFFLYLEALLKSQQTYPDGSPRVISTSPHVPVKLPAAK